MNIDGFGVDKKGRDAVVERMYRILLLVHRFFDGFLSVFSKFDIFTRKIYIVSPIKIFVIIGGEGYASEE